MKRIAALYSVCAIVATYVVYKAAVKPAARCLLAPHKTIASCQLLKAFQRKMWLVKQLRASK